MLWIYPPLRLQMPEKAAELAACIGDGSVESAGWCQVGRLSSRRKLEARRLQLPANQHPGRQKRGEMGVMGSVDVTALGSWLEDRLVAKVY